MSIECNGKCESCLKVNECSDPKKEKWEQDQKLKRNLSKIKA
ncbi:MAG: hypothetical protein QXT31_05805 [Candidatus Bathyarchaeia archaeon]